MYFATTQINPNTYKIVSLFKKIDRLEMEFRYLRVVGTKDEVISMESEIGKYYRILMREVTKNNLKSIIETESDYQIVINKKLTK